MIVDEDKTSSCVIRLLSHSFDVFSALTELCNAAGYQLTLNPGPTRTLKALRQQVKVT